MPTALRESLLLICGVLLGIVVGAAIILFFNLDPDKPVGTSLEEPAQSAEQSTARMGAPAAPGAREQGAAAAPASTPTPGTQQGGTTATTPVVATRATCPVRPLLATAGPKDGQLLPPADVAGRGVDEAERLLTVGKEAAAAGQVRDAEVALLTSCRIADARKGAGSVESASAKYQLARHYSGLAAQGNAPAPEREELRRRSEALYVDSLQVFRTALGPEHERTRFAAEGLAALQRTAVAGGAAGGSPAAGPPAATAAAPAQQNAGAGADTARQAGAPAQAPAATTAARTNPPAAAPAEPATAATRTQPPAAAANERSSPRENAARPSSEPRVRQATGTPNASLGGQEPAETFARPSFDCARARSVPEKIICSDAELSRMDRDLSRLHARAKDAAPDPSAFKRQNDNEWRRREASCRDRGCLVEWYEQRRRQLQESLARSSGRRGQETAAR